MTPSMLHLRTIDLTTTSIPNTRLINHSKSGIGIISSCILDTINSDIRTTGLIQWNPGATVINWLCSIGNISASRFTHFDIVDFYLSIHKPLLLKALTIYLHMLPLPILLPNNLTNLLSCSIFLLTVTHILRHCMTFLDQSQLSSYINRISFVIQVQNG